MGFLRPLRGISVFCARAADLPGLRNIRSLAYTNLLMPNVRLPAVPNRRLPNKCSPSETGHQEGPSGAFPSAKKDRRLSSPAFPAKSSLLFCFRVRQRPVFGQIRPQQSFRVFHIAQSDFIHAAHARKLCAISIGQTFVGVLKSSSVISSA